jgi:hypothetical protein
MVNLTEIQLQIQRAKLEEPQEQKRLAYTNPWFLSEIDRLHCFQAKIKHENFQERDFREFKRLVKKYHNVKMTLHKFDLYASRMIRGI